MYCIFTNLSAEISQGSHIVPFSKGDAWLKTIVDTRIADNEDISNLTSINDIRNGTLVANTLHPMLAKRKLVVLTTPNSVLDCADIPARSNNDPDLDDDVKYSTNSHIPNNKDAAFKEHTYKPKPSSTLLNYNYGVAALKWWGNGTDGLLLERARPSPAIPAPMGPSHTKHDRSIATVKFNNVHMESPGGSWLAGGGGAEDQDTCRQMDAEQLVLMLWANAPAARDYREKEQWCSHGDAWRKAHEDSRASFGAESDRESGWDELIPKSFPGAGPLVCW
ncbi:hypothetical protein B0H10DRAFT_2060302 [Mycena sp. CBHHK59/15]|nr:hypothetical protein B0H10DRAFT_2060302 [Mycena sp. CBHHK59/15]